METERSLTRKVIGSPGDFNSATIGLIHAYNFVRESFEEAIKEYRRIQKWAREQEKPGETEQREKPRAKELPNDEVSSFRMAAGFCYEILLKPLGQGIASLFTPHISARRGNPANYQES